MEEGRIATHISLEGIATVSFSHPQSNSLPSALLRKLAEAITEMNQREEVKVMVLRSEGKKAFCAGASFDELLSIESLEQGLHFFSGFAHVINAMRKSDKFIIGRVHEKAVGGGVGLAAATDYCVAVSVASVKLSELAVGIGPFVVGPAVERKIGVSAFAQLSMNASEWYDSQWAKAKGLFTEVVADEVLLDSHINNLAYRLSAFNPEAMREMKRMYWKGTEHWDELLIERAGISGRLVMSDFTRSAIELFKRK
jgi:methylglutaconyl-CoA hydratase